MIAARSLPRVPLHHKARALAALLAVVAAAFVLHPARAASPDASGWNLDRLMSTLGWRCEEVNEDETRIGRDSIASFAFRRRGS